MIFVKQFIKTKAYPQFQNSRNIISDTINYLFLYFDTFKLILKGEFKI